MHSAHKSLKHKRQLNTFFGLARADMPTAAMAEQETIAEYGCEFRFTRNPVLNDS